MGLMKKNFLVKIDGETREAEFLWASEKGPWTFFRVDGRLRAILNEDIIDESNQEN